MNEKRNAFWYLFGGMWHYSVGNRKNVLLYTLMFIGAELIDTILSPFIWAKAVEIITLQGINEQSLFGLMLCLASIPVRMIGSWALHGPARCIERNNAFMIRVNKYGYLLKGVMTLPLKWHKDHHTGDTIDKVNKGTTAMFEFAEVSFIPIRCLIQLFGCYGMILYLSYRGACIATIVLIFSAWLTARFDRLLVKQWDELNEYENQVSESVIDAISKISTIIILRAEKSIFNAIMHKLQKPYELFKQNQRLNEWKWFLTSVCCNTMIMILVGVFFYEHWGAGPGVASSVFVLFTSYLQRMGDLYFRFADMYGTMAQRKAKVVNSTRLSQDFRPENFTNHVLPPDWKEIAVSKLVFSYENDKELHLDTLSFSISRGEHIALVGETGSGKSTLLKIMGNLYQPQKIKLLVDGKEIPDGFGGISRASTLFQQDYEMFANSVYENLTMGGEYDWDIIEKSMHMACFDEVLPYLPKGLDSKIKEKGVNLSGGQQQRLAIARGLIASYDKDIVLLDEPTSSLDIRTALKVMGRIFDGFAGKTLIVTNHQPYLLPMFDRIIVLDHGKIIACGTHGELMISCPKYASIWEAMHKATNQSFASVVK